MYGNQHLILMQYCQPDPYIRTYVSSIMIQIFLYLINTSTEYEG